MTHESPKFYVPVETLEIPGYGHQRVQTVELEILNSPFKPSKVGNLSTVGIETEETINEPSPLCKISPIHGRSFEYADGRIVWMDEFGNIYTALNTKGNNLTNPLIFPDSSSNLEFSVHGLQTSVGLTRQIKASQIMRSAGIETEAITHAIEPLALPYKGQMLPIEDFKNKLKEAALGPNQDSYLEAQITKYLSSITFFMTGRATQVNERIHDLLHMDDDAREKALCNAFFYTNLYEKVKAKKDPTHTALHFDVKNPTSVEFYLNQYLPAKIGKNYAKLHSLGLIHKYPTLSNVSLAGSIADLDSVRGYLLGDTYYDIVGHKNDDLRDVDKFKMDVLEEVRLGHQVIPDIARFVRSLTDSYLAESIKKPGYPYIHTANIYSLMDPKDLEDVDPTAQESDVFAEYFSFTLEKSELPEIDVEKIARTIAEANLYSDNGSPITLEQKFIIFKKTVMLLIETTFDPITRIVHGRTSLTAHVLQEEEKDDKALMSGDRVDHIYHTFVQSKTSELINRNSEVLIDLFGEPKMNPDEDGELKKNDQAFVEAVVTIIKDLGWENDIAHHAFDIEQFLEIGVGRVGRNIRHKLLQRYVGLFSEQTGITLPWSDKVTGLIDEFHQQDKEKAEKLASITMAIENETLGFSDTLSALRSIGELQKYFSEKFAEDRFCFYVVDKILDWQEALDFKSVLFDACENAETAKVLYDWFFSKAAYDPVDAISKKTRKRINEHSESALKRYGFANPVKIDRKNLRKKLIR